MYESYSIAAPVEQSTNRFQPTISTAEPQYKPIFRGRSTASGSPMSVIDGSKASTAASGTVATASTVFPRSASEALFDSSSKFRQLPCRTFISVGTCPYRERCVYLHDPRCICKEAKTKTRRKNKEDVVLDALFWPVMPYNMVAEKLDNNRQPHVIQPYSVPLPQLDAYRRHDDAVYSMWMHFVDFCQANSDVHTHNASAFNADAAPCYQAPDLPVNAYTQQPRLAVFQRLSRCGGVREHVPPIDVQATISSRSVSPETINHSTTVGCSTEVENTDGRTTNYKRRGLSADSEDSESFAAACGLLPADLVGNNSFCTPSRGLLGGSSVGAISGSSSGNQQQEELLPPSPFAPLMLGPTAFMPMSTSTASQPAAPTAKPTTISILEESSLSPVTVVALRSNRGSPSPSFSCTKSLSKSLFPHEEQLQPNVKPPTTQRWPSCGDDNNAGGHYQSSFGVDNPIGGLCLRQQQIVQRQSSPPAFNVL